jgi:YfiH family protein
VAGVTPHLTAPILAPFAGIAHGFFTRVGGVSGGIYASLNCGLGSRDSREHVAQNRSRVAVALGVPAGALVTPYQVHGTHVIAVTAPWDGGNRPQADALVTDRPGIAIGVGTADCGPILLADPTARVVGAAHAGWKGALAGVVESTVAAMEGLGARRDRMVAALGPTISQANYEVGPELVAQFVADDPGNARFFAPSPNPGGSQFDLPEYIIARLRRAGIASESLAFCTYADPARFFSFRRATHRGEADYGRELSVIVITE